MAVRILLALTVVVGFALGTTWLRLPARAREAATLARESFGVLRDPSLDDLAKERTLQRKTGRLVRLSGVLIGGSLVSLGLPLLLIWFLELLGIASLAAVLSTLEEPFFLAGTVAAGGLGYGVLRAVGRT